MTRRLVPLAPGEWPAEMGDALAALRPPKPRHPMPERRDDRPKGLNILGLLAHHPDLTSAFHTFTGHVLFATTLSLRQRELLILRVAALREAEYEWLQHKVIGGDVGLTPDEIGRVVDGPDADGWDAPEAALVRAVDELLADARIAEGTYAELSGALSPQQLLDLVFTVGAYDALAMAMRTFDVAVDDDLDTWR